MINNDNWETVFKLNEICSFPTPTNLIYIPTISPNNDMLCMHYNTDIEKYPTKFKEIINFFFERELNFLKLFQDKTWCPTLYDVDLQNKKILIEFNHENLSWPIYDKNRSIDIEYPMWKDHLFEILSDLNNSGYYKSTIYPHCFFYNDKGQLKMIDYYATIKKDDTLIHKNLIEPIISENSKQRFAEVKTGDYYEMGNFFKNSLQKWIKWPGDPLPEFYRKIFL